MAYIVQQGQATLSDGFTANVTINEVNSLSRAFVILHHPYGQPRTNTSNPMDSAMCSGYLQSTTNLRIQRQSATVFTTVGWTVIECTEEEFEVQRGSDSFSCNGLTSNKTISSVDTNHTFAWWNGCTADMGAGTNIVDEALWTATITSSTNLRLQRGSDQTLPCPFPFGGVSRWIAVEFDPNKYGGMATGEKNVTTELPDGPASSTISGISKDQTLVFAQCRSTQNSIDSCSFGIYLRNDTTLEFFGDGQGDRTIQFHAIDFGPKVGKRYENPDNFTGIEAGVSNMDQTLDPPADNTRAVSFVTGSCNGSGTAFPRNYQYHHVPDPGGDGTSVVTIRRVYTGQIRNLTWQVLELPSDNNSPFFGCNF